MVKLQHVKLHCQDSLKTLSGFLFPCRYANQLRDGIRVLSLNHAAMRKPVSPSALRRFSVDGANLPIVIQDLKNKTQMTIKTG